MLRPDGPPVIWHSEQIDALPRQARLLPLLEEYRKRYTFAEYLPISAQPAKVSTAAREVIKRLPEGPEYFPPDHFTDQPARFLAAELIREKIPPPRIRKSPLGHRLIDKWEELAAADPHLRHHLVERDGPEGHRHRREGVPC
jgi:hypothetical protein